MELSERTKQIMAWREHISTLPDDVFFPLMRTYLGEIKTPYNKQSLVESLSAFFRKEENRRNIMSLLDDADVQFLCAITFVPDATKEKLTRFFEGTFSAGEVSARLRNLDERLLIFQRAGEKGRVTLVTNPFLSEELAGRLTFSDLVGVPTVESACMQPVPCVSPALVASFLSFLLDDGDCCKSDGSFKKKSLGRIEQVYAAQLSQNRDAFLDVLRLMALSLTNIGLFHEGEKGLVPDFKKLEQFAALEPKVMCSYLAAAANKCSSRFTLRADVQFVLDLVSSVPQHGLTRPMLMRLSYLLRERDGYSTMSRGRFAFLRQDDGQAAENEFVDATVSACIAFGMVRCMGYDAGGHAVYGASAEFCDPAKTGSGSVEVDAGFSITVLPGLSLGQLLPLCKCLSLTRFDVAASYEITRESATRAFDSGMTDGDIMRLLSERCSHEVPQGIQVSLEEWYQSYKSVGIYKGYVLSLAPPVAAALKRSPVMSRRIIEELSPGIFMMNFDSDDQAKSCVQRLGLGFVPALRVAQEQRVSQPFFVPERTRPIELVAATKGTDKARAASLAAELSAALEQLDASAEQKEAIQELIDRRVVVSASQIRGGGIRAEKLEAEGMDYHGKLRVVETAMRAERPVEVTVAENNNVYRGLVMEIADKKSSNAIVKVRLEKTGKTVSLSVAGAAKIKVLPVL